MMGFLPILSDSFPAAHGERDEEAKIAVMARPAPTLAKPMLLQ